MTRTSLRAAAVATIALLAAANPASAAPTSSSSGYGLLVDLSVASVVDVGIGPVALSSGSAPPAFGESSSLATLDADIILSSLGLASSLIGVSTGLIETAAGGDLVSASASASVNDLALGAIVRLPLLETTLGGISADTIQASAEVTSVGGLSATGGTVIEDLELFGVLGGLLGIEIGGLVAADPNTVLLDVLGLSVILNEQIVDTDGTSFISLTTNALHLSFDDFLLGTNLITGDIIISQAMASLTIDPADEGGDPVDVPEPASLALLGLGPAAVGAARRRRNA